MAKVRKRVLPSGETRWLADYTDGSGRRRAKQFKKQEDAKQWLVKTLRDLQLGTHIPDSASITVKEAARLWLAHCDDEGLERSTRTAYEQHVRLHIVPLLGSRKLSQLTPPAIHGFVDELKKERSPAMVKRIVRSLGAIFGEARRRGLAVTNPVAGVKVQAAADRRKDKLPKMPEIAELKKLLDAAKGKHRALIVTAIFSGCRASELRALRWQNVDLKEGTIKVCERADAWGNIGDPKSAAGHREVPLAPYCVNALREHKLKVPSGDDQLVFASRRGTPMHHANLVNKIWNPLQVAAGIVDQYGKPKYNFHCLRHAAVSLFVEAGMNAKRISSIMGHSSTAMTLDVYAKLFENRDADQTAVAAIEARLLG